MDDLVELHLVPVEVFGTESYGLSDAVSSWSDCNRAVGKIYRVDDIDDRAGKGRITVPIYVKKQDLPFFEKKWGADGDDGELTKEELNA